MEHKLPFSCATTLGRRLVRQRDAAGKRRMRSALRHERLSIAKHLAQALHHSSGPRQPVNVVESGDVVEGSKLPHGAQPEALAGASEPHVSGLRACLVMSQTVENVVAVPKIDSGGLLSGTEELHKAISMGLLDTALFLGVGT